MKLLVLGGTKFLGRAIVDAALARGDEVTLFNRGLTNPGLFPEVERVNGDRTSDLSPLAGRSWDGVVDVAAYNPREVEHSTSVLRDQAERYTFVSTVSVYADLSVPPVEGAAVAELTDPEDESLETYGARKAACERVVEHAFGERALVVRPGLIVGPHDPTDRFTYWPRRVAAGGTVLAPGSPDDPVQFVDVRDLGDWIVRATEAGTSGTLNATGESLPFADLLDECKHVTHSDAEFVWLPSDRLLAAGVEEWMGVPLWVASPGWKALNRVVVAKAVAAGLTFRPLAETIADTLAWELHREWPRAEGVGLTPEREQELLELG
ncbi:MAG TPA: NAD-dependent epimerase/dehydratase family protein [Gaiellaceae bacterium]